MLYVAPALRAFRRAAVCVQAACVLAALNQDNDLKLIAGGSKIGEGSRAPFPCIGNDLR